MGFPGTWTAPRGPGRSCTGPSPGRVEGGHGPKAPSLWDERRTTVDAHRILQQAGKNAKKRQENGRRSSRVPDLRGLPGL